MVTSLVGGSFCYTDYRVIAELCSTFLTLFQAESPPYWSIDEWCRGFRNLLGHLHLEKVRFNEENKFSLFNEP